LNSRAAIVAAGFDRETVVKVERMLNLADKRRQAVPRRQGDVAQFRQRPPLSHHQPLPRSRHAAAPTESVAAPGGPGGNGG
jgi:hypothetical protein